ncbi:SPFH domain-containing protein [Oscillatoria salina]|uniref:SPFH domain-containing protein n=1 Tax=Oscillatoria salina TaxID=331517 RepID=UPI001CCFA952|nr:SPFH domain-containing protein [Oscillatoria salina]
MSLLISTIIALIAWIIVYTPEQIAVEKNRQTVRAIAFLVAILASLISLYRVMWRFAIVIPAGNVGVVEVFGQVSDRTLNPGVHLINPFADIITEKNERESISIRLYC